MASVIARLFEGLIDVSPKAQKKMITWEHKFIEVMRWAGLNGRLPDTGDDKRLYRWLEAQQDLYEIGELNVVQSKKIGRVMSRFGNGGGR